MRLELCVVVTLRPSQLHTCRVSLFCGKLQEQTTGRPTRLAALQKTDVHAILCQRKV